MTVSAVEQALTIATHLTQQFEGLRLKPYLCPAGVPTIGYGCTFHPDGTSVTLQDEPIDAETADEWLWTALFRTYLPGVLKASPTLIDHPTALGALTDFAFNLGVSRYRASTLRRYVDDGDFSAAEDELHKWVWSGGRKLPGLVRRRKAEAEYLCL